MHTEKIIEYITLQNNRADLLDKEVNELLQKGFQPFGSPFVIKEDTGKVWFCQAMVRYGFKS